MTVPMHRELYRGTHDSIARLTGISREELVYALR